MCCYNRFKTELSSSIFSRLLSCYTLYFLSPYMDLCFHHSCLDCFPLLLTWLSLSFLNAMTFSPLIKSLTCFSSFFPPSSLFTLCLFLPHSEGRLEVNMSEISLEDIERSSLEREPSMAPGGFWKPKDCLPRWKVSSVCDAVKSRAGWQAWTAWPVGVTTAWFVPYRAQKVPKGLWQIVAKCLTGEFWGNDVHPFCKGCSFNILFVLNYTDKQSCFLMFIFSDATLKMHKKPRHPYCVTMVNFENSLQRVLFNSLPYIFCSVEWCGSLLCHTKEYTSTCNDQEVSKAISPYSCP